MECHSLVGGSLEIIRDLREREREERRRKREKREEKMGR